MGEERVRMVNEYSNNKKAPLREKPSFKVTYFIHQKPQTIAR